MSNSNKKVDKAPRQVTNVVAARPEDTFLGKTIKTPVVADGTTDCLLDIPPRYMWGCYEDTHADTNGYCGETSFQSMGIYHGQWISLEHIRNAGDKKELLVGETDEKTADVLKYNYEVFEAAHEPHYNEFMKFVKKNIDKGTTIVAGFFMKQEDDPELDYDHIMPIIGYKANDKGHVCGLFYNDLCDVVNTHRFLAMPSDATNRDGAMGKQLKQSEWKLPRDEIFAVALEGFEDESGECYRMKITVPKDREPDWGKTDKLNQKPESWTVSATIIDLTVGDKYVIVRYDSIKDLPSKNFLKGKYSRRFELTATAVNVTLPDFDSWMTNGCAIYRCVDPEGDDDEDDEDDDDDEDEEEESEEEEEEEPKKKKYGKKGGRKK